MSTTEIVFRTVIVMILIFAVIIAILLRRYGAPNRKHDGYLDVLESDSRMIYQLEIVTPPEKLRDQKRVVLRVRKVNPDS